MRQVSNLPRIVLIFILLQIQSGKHGIAYGQSFFPNFNLGLLYSGGKVGLRYREPTRPPPSHQQMFSSNGHFGTYPHTPKVAQMVAPTGLNLAPQRVTTNDHLIRTNNGTHFYYTTNHSVKDQTETGSRHHQALTDPYHFNHHGHYYPGPIYPHGHYHDAHGHFHPYKPHGHHHHYGHYDHGHHDHHHHEHYDHGHYDHGHYDHGYHDHHHHEHYDHGHPHLHYGYHFHGHPKHHDHHYPHGHHFPHIPGWGWGYGWGWVRDPTYKKPPTTHAPGSPAPKIKPIDLKRPMEGDEPGANKPECAEVDQPTGFTNPEEIIRDGWLVVPAKRPKSPVDPGVIFEVPKVPRVPPKIKVGITEPLPQNYSLVFAERMEMSIRSDLDRFAPDGTPIDVKTTIYFTGGSIPDLKMEDMKANRMYVFSMIVQAPNISAPINGTDNYDETKVNLFDMGLEEKRKNVLDDESEEKSSPLEVQVKLVGNLFSELQARVQQAEDEKVTERLKQPKGHDPEMSRSKVEAPMIVVQSQRYSLPDPGSSEKTILDSVYNFGFQAQPIDFGDAEVPLMMWDKGQEEGEVSLTHVDELGCTVDEISDNIGKWITEEVRFVRKMSGEVHGRAEERAYQGFKQYQYLMTPNMTKFDPECPLFPIDPGYSNAGSPGAYGLMQGSYKKPRRTRSRFSR